jgi:hypothetical protein
LFRVSAARLARAAGVVTASRLRTATAPARAAALRRLTSGHPGKLDTMKGKALVSVVSDPMAPTRDAPSTGSVEISYKNVKFEP